MPATQTASRKKIQLLNEGNVTVMVSDMARALRFYTKTLGFKLKYKAGKDWSEIQAPGLTIGLHGMGEHSHGSPSGKSESLSIGFTVKRLETAMEALKKKGVQFSPRIVDEGPVRLAFFSDPDETPLYLCQILPHKHPH